MGGGGEGSEEEATGCLLGRREGGAPQNAVVEFRSRLQHVNWYVCAGNSKYAQRGAVLLYSGGVVQVLLGHRCHAREQVRTQSLWRSRGGGRCVTAKGVETSYLVYLLQHGVVGDSDRVALVEDDLTPPRHVAVRIFINAAQRLLRSFCL